MLVITRGASERHVIKYHGVAARDVSNIMDTKLVEVMSVTGRQRMMFKTSIAAESSGCRYIELGNSFIANIAHVKLLEYAINILHCAKCAWIRRWPCTLY